MSFQMIHMEIAYRLLAYIPEIENSADFILGSVAPDSVHMDPCYHVSMKVLSHMFEGCGPWSDTQDYQQWNENIKHIFREYFIGGKTAAYRDFVLGLCIHCLTDYWNDIKIWRKLQQKYIPPMSLSEFKDAYYPEARGMDLWLYQNSKNTKAIREMLSEATAFDIPGLVHKKNAETQRSHLLNVQYSAGMIDVSNYHFLSTDTMISFISFTVNAINKTIRSWSADT